jgi:hypothetical protein
LHLVVIPERGSVTISQVVADDDYDRHPFNDYSGQVRPRIRSRRCRRGGKRVRLPSVTGPDEAVGTSAWIEDGFLELLNN